MISAEHMHPDDWDDESLQVHLVTLVQYLPAESYRTMFLQCLNYIRFRPEAEVDMDEDYWEGILEEVAARPLLDPSEETAEDDEAWQLFLLHSREGVDLERGETF